MSSSPELLALLAEPQPAGATGRRASVLVMDRHVDLPSLPDLGGLSTLATTIDDHGHSSLRDELSRDAGYEAGLAEGRAHAAAESGAERAALLHARVAAEQLVAALGAAVEEARRQRAVALDGVSTQLAEAAIELAAAVIGREVVTGADALARAIALAPARATGTARLHPDDLAGLDVAPGSGITLEADPTVERGGCILELPDATIDAQLGAALERARTALLDQVEVAW